MFNSGAYANNWVFYFIAVGMCLIIIWCIATYVKNNHTPNDSFYFLVVDEFGNESFIHDSGIRPSKTAPGRNIYLQVVKNEIDSGKMKELFRPSYVKMGMNHKDLKWNIYPENVIDDDELYYTLVLKAPDNPFYGKKNITFPQDQKEECEEITTKVDQ